MAKSTTIQLRRTAGSSSIIGNYTPEYGEPIFYKDSAGKHKFVIGDSDEGDIVDNMIGNNLYYPNMKEILELYVGNIQLSKIADVHKNASFNDVTCRNISCSIISDAQRISANVINNVTSLTVTDITTSAITPKSDSILIGENNPDTFEDYIDVSSDGIDITATDGISINGMVKIGNLSVANSNRIQISSYNNLLLELDNNRGIVLNDSINIRLGNFVLKLNGNILNISGKNNQTLIKLTETGNMYMRVPSGVGTSTKYGLVVVPGTLDVIQPLSIDTSRQA